MTTTGPRTDETRFEAVVRSALGPSGELFFDPRRPVVTARAPGRLDLMGGISDYSGGLVLQWPMAEATFVAAQHAENGLVAVKSLDGSQTADSDEELELTPRSFVTPVDEVRRLATAGYAEARAAWTADTRDAWAAYPLGVLAALVREEGIDLGSGMLLLAWSTVPEAKGVSSSAALEVATMRAVAGLLGLRLSGSRLAHLCQLAENQVVGAPCGIMDQMTSALGRDSALLALLCQPDLVEGFVPLPTGLSVYAVDSGVRHAVSGSDYTSVRVGAFMGYRIIAGRVGLPVTHTESGRVLVEDPQWGGYLANIESDVFAARFEAGLPESMTGSAFLQAFTGTTDAVTRIDHEARYAIRIPTAHPVYERARVERFRSLLLSGSDETSRQELGRLMLESHRSYSACGLGSEATDRLVELAMEAGPERGIYGAKITGGGSGGCVAILGRSGMADQTVREIAGRFRSETGSGGAVFTRSSDGAMARGIRHVTLDAPA